MGLQDKIRKSLGLNEDVGFIEEKLILNCVKNSTPWQVFAFYVSPKKEEKIRVKTFYSVPQPPYYTSVGGGDGRVGSTVWMYPDPEVHEGGDITKFNKPLDQHLNKFMDSMLKCIGIKPTITTECSLRPTSRGGYITIGGYCFREPIATEQIDRRVQITDQLSLSALKEDYVPKTQGTIEDMTTLTHYKNIFIFPMPTKQFADRVAKDPLDMLFGILYDRDNSFNRKMTKNEKIIEGIKAWIDAEYVGRTYSFPDHIHKFA